MLFLKEFFEKFDLEKKSADDKHEKIPRGQRVILPIMTKKFLVFQNIFVIIIPQLNCPYKTFKGESVIFLYFQT